MELNITELDKNMYDDSFENYDNEPIQSSFEQIPENNVPIKIVKKGVHFDDSVLHVQNPTHQSIPKTYSKIVRPQMPNQKPRISYEDILSKMGMLVSDGKLHLIDRNILTPQKQNELLSYQTQQEYKQEYQQEPPVYEKNIPQNSYIYNKLFKDELQAQNIIRRPRTLEEYKRMLIDDYIQRQRIKQMKSTKLVMPTSNINISARHSENLKSFYMYTNEVNQNKLFTFSKR